MKLLSIVIPIYNVEKYIENCLCSILPQVENRDDVEIILINDGTKDNSAKITQELILNFPNAKLFNQVNQGLSAARNNGLHKSSGKYVWFIDSDDTIECDSISNLIPLLSQDIDLIQLNFQKTYEDKRHPIPVLTKFEGILSGKEVIAKGGLPAPAQFTIYNRRFLLDNSLEFLIGILHEDSEFKPRVTYLAKSILFHKPIVYNYLQRMQGNIMSKFSYKNAVGIISGINSLINFSNKNITDIHCKTGLRKIIGMNINSLLAGLRKMHPEDKNLTLKLINENKHLFKEMLKSYKLKYVLEAMLLIANHKFAIKLYSIFG